MKIAYTDGLPDSIRGDDPEARIRDAFTARGTSISALTALVDGRPSGDDITIVLLKRMSGVTPA